MMSGLGAPMISMLGPLFAVLGVLAVAAVLARRFRGRRFGLAGNGNAQIQIIATRVLGAQTSLLIVEAEGKRFLIASARGTVTGIGSLASQEIPLKCP